MPAWIAALLGPSAVVLSSVTPQPAGWLLRTDDTALLLSASDRGAVVRNLQAVGDGFDWTHEGLAAPLPASVEVDGKQVRLEWTLGRTDCAPEDGTVTLEYRCTAPQLVYRSHWRARPGRGPVETWAELGNATGAAIGVGSIPSLSLPRLQAPEGATAYWIKRGASNASVEGGTYAVPVAPALDLELVSDPIDGASAVPWLALQQGERRGLYVGWEFSGAGGIRATSRADGAVALAVGFRAEFSTALPAGETLEIPPAFVGCYRGGVDDGGYSLHRFILEKLRPPMPAGYPDPTLAYNLFLDAGGAQAREEAVLRCARICADLGFETFVPDAMWFPQVGDWRWDPARFPHGAEAVERLTHESGMKLGMWCAWTNAGNSAEPGALSAHRQTEWFCDRVGDDWQPGPFWGLHLCLGCDEARDWAIRETDRIVREFRLDYLKHDIEPIITQCRLAGHRHTNATDVSYWATLGYYRVMDALLANHPDLVLENCSGGGHIKDFGAMKRAHYLVTTDTLSNLPDRQSIYDSTFAFPPLLLQAYTYDNCYPVEGDEPGPFLWRSAMMGAWQIDPTDALKWGAEEKAEAKREVEVYKRWIRPILQDAKVHHVLPRPDGTSWDGLFLWSAVLRRGTLYAFRPASDQPEKTVRLAGLDADRSYWVWSEDGSIAPDLRTGGELMARGVTLRLPTRYSCDLVFVQDSREGEPDGLRAPGAFGLREPRVEADAFATTVGLRWEASEGARSYLLRVSEHADLASPVVERQSVLPESACTGLEPGRTYYWSVSAGGWGGTTPCEAAGSFEAPGLAPTPGVRFLSACEWLSATAGADNPVRRDVNYGGKRPTIGGKAFPRALWTHSFDDTTPADVVFDVSDDTGDEFRAEVGLDDASGGGSVQFQVLLDGALAAATPVLRPGECRSLAVPLEGARRLTLRVLNGGDGYSCDHSVWGFARIVAPGAEDPCL